MNAEALRAEPDHVREEFARLRDVNRALEAGLQEAVRALRSARAGEKLDLPGRPRPDAAERHWVDYFLRRGALRAAS
jgi:hypothetical protein